MFPRQKNEQRDTNQRGKQTKKNRERGDRQRKVKQKDKQTKNPLKTPRRDPAVLKIN
jgi:hypothetical protein